MACFRPVFVLLILVSLLSRYPARGGVQGEFDGGEVYRRIRSYLQSVAAIDTHDHLPPFERLPGYLQTEWGRGMNLASIWKNSYFTCGNPETKFVLFHGGFPWIHESGAIVMSSLMNRHANVWLDSVWLPTLSPLVARRALAEWLEIMPSNRILWGVDCNHAEGITGPPDVEEYPGRSSY